MINWQSVLVGPNVSLEDALSIMDKGALKIAVIVDEKRRLLGTLTDGDVRRALLNHVSLEVPVEQVMCASPHTAKPSWTRDQTLAEMESLVLLQLPVVDDEGIVVGLQTLHGLLDKPHISNPVFLMAGGFGTRLQPLTENCPKPLLKIGEKPLLELTLERLVSAGFKSFYISTHYLPEMIREYFGDGSQWGVDVQYTHEDNPLGTGGALGLLPHDEITEPVLLMNGDLLTTLNYQELISFHKEHSSIATMGVRSYEHQVPYGVIENDGHKLLSMVEKPVHKYFVNAGVYVLEPELIRSVKSNEYIDMPTLLHRWMQKGREISTFPIREYWLDIGKIEDFNRAQLEVQNIF